MYTPITEQIKRELQRTFRRANLDDVENAVTNRFLHLVWKYNPHAGSKKMSFSMWLKKYLKGWCYRFMNDQMGTGKKSGQVLASAIRDSELEGNYTDIVGLSDAGNIELGQDAKVTAKKGVEFIRAECGDKAADAFVHKHLYGMTQSEIAEVLGCTQAKVSKILVEAERVFKDRLIGRSPDVDVLPEDDDGQG